MRTQILIATISVLSMTLMLNSACSNSRVTHSSVSDKQQPQTSHPDSSSTPKKSEAPASSSIPPRSDSASKPSEPPDLSTELANTAPDNTFEKNTAHPAVPVPTPEAAQSDADIKLAARVRTAITSDNRLTDVAGSITVLARSGLVTLQGRVNDPEQKEAAESVTKDVPGVERVDNQLVTQRD